MRSISTRFEQTLYNGYLSGVSIKGDSFFYQNPLEANAQSRNNERSAYFDVACCPANLARLMAQVPELIYSTARQRSIRQSVHQQRGEAEGRRRERDDHADSRTIRGTGGCRSRSARIGRSMFPLKHSRSWVAAARRSCDGSLSLHRCASSPRPCRSSIAVRARSTAGLTATFQRDPEEQSSASTSPSRCPSVACFANDGIKENAGKAAIQRGPLVYALEGVDNDGKVLDIVAPLTTQFTPVERKDLLGGVTALTATVPASPEGGAARQITAIPYFAWANRGRGEMVVWIRR